jgi:DNA modification methylase
MTDIHESLKPLAVSIDSLTPDPSNARKHDKRNIEAIKASLARFGQTKPIVLHSNGSTIIAGNGTWHAAKELGWTHIAAAKTSLDTAEAVAYGIADNKTAELAEWEDDTLRDLMDALPDDLKLATGFEGDEIAEMLRLPSDEVHEDEVPPVPKEPTTKIGDVWKMGSHTLICGDSSSEEVVRQILPMQSVDILWTDPPYGVAYKAMRGSREIENDQDEATAYIMMKSALSVVSSDCSFVACNWRSMAITQEAMESTDRAVKTCIVWDKKHGVQNLDKFYKQHEFVLYAGPYGGCKTVDGDVWQIDRDFDPDHPTPKPVELITRSLNAVEGSTVYDPFSGSGSTLIACEQVGKDCFAVELDCAYCDVIVQRWENLTGKKAERVPAEVGDASTVGS